MNRLALTLALALTTACAAPMEEEELEATESAISGNFTTEEGVPAAIGIYTEDSAGKRHICTGALVAPSVVLTAAHCVVKAKKFLVFVGSKLSASTERSNVFRAIAHPEYNSEAGDETGTADIAALLLTKPLTVAPLAIQRERLDKSDVGASVKIVGYGRTDRDDLSTAEIKRSGTARLSRILTRELYVAPTQNGATACAGDSGGPTLLRQGSGRTPGWSLIGLESHATPGDKQCKLGTYKTRVDTFLPFIDAAIARGSSKTNR